MIMIVILDVIDLIDQYSILIYLSIIEMKHVYYKHY